MKIMHDKIFNIIVKPFLHFKSTDVGGLKFMLC